MSEMLDRLEAQIATARRARDTARLVVLTVLLSKIQKIAKDDREKPGRLIQDSDVFVGASTYVAETSEVRDIYEKRGMDHAKEDAEIAIVSEYLPTMLTEQELIAVIDGQLADTERNPKAIGKVVAYLKERHAAAYDPKAAMRLIKERIN